MNNRYNHPFWNGWFMNKVASVLVYLNSWVWYKQYGQNK